MHPVNDARWIRSHGDFAEGQSSKCNACHGADHLGTRLSKAAADRSFSIEGRVKTISAGTPVPCNLCHSLRTSFGD
jgi:hypothetical protein